MSEDAQVLQFWVRTDKARVFGPLAPTSIELLLENGVIVGRVQLSRDGENWVLPGRMPGLRVIFPRELWGDEVLDDPETDAAFSQVVLPPPLPSDAPQAPASPRAAVPGPPPGGPARPAIGPPVARAPVARQPMAPGTRVPPAIRAPSSPSSVAAPPLIARPSGISSPSGVAASPGSLFDDLTPPPNAPAPALRPAGPPAAPPPAARAPGPPVSTPSGMRQGPGVPANPVAAVTRAPPLAPSRPSAVAAAPSPDASAAAPVRDELEVPSLPASGSLETTSALRLYGLAAAGEVNARLTFTLNDRVLQVHFKRGSPEFVDSNHLEDSLPSFLLSRSLATPDQIAQAEAQKARFGGELLPALFGLGLLNPSTAFQHLTERAAHLVFKLLTAERGSFVVEHVELPGAKAMPLGNKWSVFLEQLRRVPGLELRRRLASSMDSPVQRANSWVALGQLKLLPQEVRALNSFDGTHSLAQLAAQAPNDGDVLLRTAWMLSALECVSFAGVTLARPAEPKVSAPPVAAPSRVPGPPPPPGVPPPPKAAPVPPNRPAAGVPGPPPGVGAPPMPRPIVTPQAPVKPPAPVAAPPRPPPAAPRPPTPVPALSFEAETKEVLALLEKMKQQNFLEILGVPRDADASKVKVAYFKLAKSYHPDTVPQNAPPVLAQAKADIFALIGEANATLSDATLKAEYLAELDAGGLKGEKIDITSLLQAEEFFQKGQVLVKNRKYPEALKSLDEAIKANDKEGEYYGWRGWAKYFTIDDKSKAHIEAMKDIEASLRANPNAASVHYFQGFLFKAKGDLSRAKASFKRCVELDPRHIDAQRELRTMAGK